MTEAPIAAGRETGSAAAGESAVGSGDPRVDAAIRRLDELPRLPLEEQVPAYDEVHTALQHTLASLDEG